MLESIEARRILFALCVVAAAGLMLASFLTVVRVSTADPAAVHASSTGYSGYDRHSISLILIALVALLTGLLALRGMPVAAWGVLLCALGALLIAIGIDLPDLQKTGTLGADVAPAKASAGPGYYVETLAAVLLVLSGAGFAAATRRRAARADPEPDSGNYQR